MDKNIKKLIEKLTKENKTISTMESCTGGGLANAITNIEGSSEVIKFSAVTYSNEYKIKMGVPKEIIDKYTVYSQETAIAMSKAISNFTGSNYGVGITGKLNKVDPYNKTGNDNEVFVSIYNRDDDTLDTFNIVVDKSSREDNKKDVIKEIIKHLL